MIFLHGSGDRGSNLLLLAKASPFMMIRETGPLPCIIVAPILQNSDECRSFPLDYLDGILKEVDALQKAGVKVRFSILENFD